MLQGFCGGHHRRWQTDASVVDIRGHGDFKQDQEAHICDNASLVDITDFLMVVAMVTLKQDQESSKMQQGFCVGQSRLTYSSGHGDFKQDQEAHRCYKASVVDIIDIGSSYGDFKTRPRGPKMQQGF